MPHPAMNRRDWLRATTALPLGLLGGRLWAAPADTPRFLLVFLRGAYDAASLLLPQDAVARTFYDESRPRIAVPRPDGGDGSARALDTDWALAPAVHEGLWPLWQAGQLAFVPFAGNRDLSRSHFETQDQVERGLGETRGPASGFLARLAAELDLPKAGGGLEVIAFTEQMPLVLQGLPGAAQVSLKSAGRPALDEQQRALVERMYAGTALQDTVREGFQTRQEVLREMTGEMAQANRNAIAARGFEAEARRIGRLLRERVALGFIDIGGWDTHANQGAAQGTLATRLGELSRGLAALAAEAGPATWQRTTVVVISEFGRTWRENGTRGTDHGHGSAYWVLGGAVRGGALRGEQVALRPDTLNQGRDWPVLNEYRALLAGLWARQYGLRPEALARVFPGAPAARDLGLV